MKKVTLLCLLIASFSAFGQSGIRLTQKQAKEKCREIIQSSPYIFEATVVPDSYFAYFNADSSQTYGTYLVEIHQVYKGNLGLGTVQMIFEGADIQYRKNGEKFIIQHSPGSARLAGDGRFIVFAKDTDYSLNTSGKNTTATNLQKIMLFKDNWSVIMWPDGRNDGKFYGPASMYKFDTEKQVYKYLRSFPGVTIPDSVYEKAATTNKYFEKYLEQRKLDRKSLGERIIKRREEKIKHKIDFYSRRISGYESIQRCKQEDHTKEIADAKKQLPYWEGKLKRHQEKTLKKTKRLEAKQHVYVEPKKTRREKKIDDKVYVYKVKIYKLKMLKEYQHEDHPEEMAEAVKQLKYWECKLERYKKRHTAKPN